MQQSPQLAAFHDDEDAGKGDQNAGDLPGRRAFALQPKRAQDDEQRHRGVHHDGIDRGRHAEAEIDQDLEERRAQSAEQSENAPVASNDLPPAGQARQHEGGKDQHGASPAPEIHRHRRHRFAQSATNDPVPRPEERGKREQQERHERGPSGAVAACRLARFSDRWLGTRHLVRTMSANHSEDNCRPRMAARLTTPSRRARHYCRQGHLGRCCAQGIGKAGLARHHLR